MKTQTGNELKLNVLQEWNSSVQFSFIYLASNHNNSWLKELYCKVKTLIERNPNNQATLAGSTEDGP